MKTRYIFVVGGVMSGIGKGIATASLGRILQSKGFNVSAVKIDPYINVDAGTMNPVEHGEVFVTRDGIECDQDGGNYERFLGIEFGDDNYITTGRVYQAVIQRERNLGYGGKCVEVIPDIPNEVIRRIEKVGDNVDFVLTEIGGTIGEYQNSLFLEAARRLKRKNSHRVLFVLVSYLPVPDTIGEMKTKPTQNAFRWLSMAGVSPDIILGRSKKSLDDPRKEKISTFCNVKKENVISAPDEGLIYKIPLNLDQEDFGNKVLKKLNLQPRKSKMGDWKERVEDSERATDEVVIGLVGKYFETGDFVLEDSYVSVIESVKHACWAQKKKPVIKWLSAGKYEEEEPDFDDLDGVIVLGGFGKRGVEGKIRVARYCREEEIPYLGLCLGLQTMIVEFARNVCGIEGANSLEFDSETEKPVIHTMPEQKRLIEEERYGGTMRLGAYSCSLKKGTKAYEAYGKKVIEERHRHRYEVNNDYKEILEKGGLIFSGINEERGLIEIAEIKKHPFMLGVQFHPEFKTRFLEPHPLFESFIRSLR